MEHHLLDGQERFSAVHVHGSDERLQKVSKRLLTLDTDGIGFIA